MAKVDWITWNTDSDDIINPDKVVEKILEIYQDFNSYIQSNIYEIVKKETQIGGLDKTSISLYGESPAFEKAIKILNQIDEISFIMNNLTNTIKYSIEEQKKLEKNDLIKAIEEKIAEEKKILENTELLKSRITSSNQVVSLEEVEEIIKMSHDKINRLQEKLELAKNI